MNQHLLLDVILAAWQHAFCHFEKKCRVAALFQNSIIFSFKGGAFLDLLHDRSQDTHKGFYLWKVTITDQILHNTIFIKIAKYEKCKKKENFQLKKKKRACKQLYMLVHYQAHDILLHYIGLYKCLSVH